MSDGNFNQLWDTASMEGDYYLTKAQIEWTKNKKKLSPSRLRELIIRQKGRCSLSNAPMLFEKKYGNPNINEAGCHPLYAAIDHISPNDESYGYQLVCYDLNDLKGHLPVKVFKELQETSAWKSLMQQWKSQAESDPFDIHAFKTLLKD